MAPMFHPIAWAYLLYFAALGVLLPHTAPILTELGYSKSAIGVVLAMVGVASTVVPVLSGRLADRWLGPAALFRWAAGIMLASACLLAVGWRPGFFVAVMLVVLALCRGPMVSLLDTLATLRTASAQEYGRMRLMGSLGFVLVVQCLSLVPAEGLDLAFRWGLIVPALGLLVIAWWLPAAAPPRRSAQLRFWSALPPRFWGWTLAMGLHWFAMGPYHYGFNLFLEELAVPRGLWGWMWTIGIGAEVLMFAGAGGLIARWGYRGVLFLACGASALRWILLWQFPSGAMAGWTQLLHGPGFALFYAGAMHGLRGWSSGAQLASLQGLFSTVVSGFFGALGFLVAGALHDRLPFSDVIGWMLVPQALAIGVLWRCPIQSPTTPEAAVQPSADGRD